jgi:SAM-dependent methyltransferase
LPPMKAQAPRTSSACNRVQIGPTVSQVKRPPLTPPLGDALRRIRAYLNLDNDRQLADKVDLLQEVIAKEVAYSSQILEGLRESTPSEPCDLFRGSTDDYWLWANTVGARLYPGLGDLLPKMPPEISQRSSASRVGDETLKDGFAVYQLFRDLISQHRTPVAGCDAILDYGCGWGRVLRFFLRDLPGEKLWGVDLWKDQVDLARSTNPYCRFLTVNQNTPSQLPDETFDAVFAFSVFSHIDHETAGRLLEEFHRVLKPGGLVIVTTWGRGRAGYFDSVSKGRQSTWENHYNEGMIRYFPGRERWLDDYDNGRYCHVDLHYEGNERYGETAIPREYVVKEWTNDFELVDFIDDRHICVQNVIVMRRPPV